MSLAYNDASRVEGVSIVLQSVTTGDTFPSTWNPQIFVGPEDNYVLSITNAPWLATGEVTYVTLPVTVPQGVMRTIDWYLLNEEDLLPFTFSVAAQTPFARSSYSELVHIPGDSITVDVRTQCLCDWWGYFVLPGSAIPVQAEACQARVCHDLNEGYDYTVDQVEGYKLVVFRVEGDVEQLKLHYEEGGIPTVSEWGLVVLTLLLLAGAKVLYARRRRRVAG